MNVSSFFVAIWISCFKSLFKSYAQVLWIGLFLLFIFFWGLCYLYSLKQWPEEDEISYVNTYGKSIPENGKCPVQIFYARSLPGVNEWERNFSCRGSHRDNERRPCRPYRNLWFGLWMKWRVTIVFRAEEWRDLTLSSFFKLIYFYLFNSFRFTEKLSGI